MKTKNNLTTGILIGIGVIVIPLILLSSKPISSNTENEVGTYQAFGANESIYMINTKTGETWNLSGGMINKRSWRKKTNPDIFK